MTKRCELCNQSKSDVVRQVEWMDDDFNTSGYQKLCKTCYTYCVYDIKENRAISFSSIRKKGRPIWWVATVIGKQPNGQMTMGDLL